MKIALALAVALSLTGCAAELSAVQSGIDGANQMLRSKCPPGTLDGSEPCTTGLRAYNAAVSGYNLALLAEAIGVDSTLAKQQAIAALKDLFAAFVPPPTAAVSSP